MSSENKVQTKWTAEIRKLLQRMCPCSRNELLYHAIELVPHAIARNSFSRRKELAATVIGQACIITDGICALRPIKQKRDGMMAIISVMKRDGKINPTGNINPATAKRYRPLLVRLQWIEVQSNGEWRWTGPDDADYKVALELHQKSRTVRK
jgi:hypothetical protein